MNDVEERIRLAFEPYRSRKDLADLSEPSSAGRGQPRRRPAYPDVPIPATPPRCCSPGGADPGDTNLYTRGNRDRRVRHLRRSDLGLPAAGAAAAYRTPRHRVHVRRAAPAAA